MGKIIKNIFSPKLYVVGFAFKMSLFASGYVEGFWVKVNSFRVWRVGPKDALKYLSRSNFKGRVR